MRGRVQNHSNNIANYVRSFNFLGLLSALVFFYISLLPSLLPRPWLYQGIVSAISASIGYGLGVLASHIIRWLFDREFPAKYKLYAWKILFIIAPITIIITTAYSSHWQNNVRVLLGIDSIEGSYIARILTVTLLLGFAIVSASRGVRWLNRKFRNLAHKLLPKNLGTVITFLSVALLLYWFVSGILFNTFVNVSNSFYGTKNDTTAEGITQPTSPYRSGSKESLVSWDTLGYQGRSFVASGPNQTQLQTYTDATTMEQIRIYVGTESARNAEERAALAVNELERTGAFNRKVIILATATGTGWLEPQSVDSIEYMYGGDSAIVTQQYSYLPSWISFLVDKQNAKDAGVALYNAVYAKWATMPRNTRPKLIAYGLSLGSFGGQAAFSGISDIKHTIDGALFIGTPSDTSLWRNVTDNREPGSPEWQPTYKQGNTVRFAASNEDILKNQEKWSFPRILYMQHASDPVVWFNFNLPLHEPDWLREPRGPDVSPNTRWYPFVTFFQITIDQFFGVNVPNGHGHNYGNTIVSAWGSIVPPTGWTTDKANKLQSIINTY